MSDLKTRAIEAIETAFDDAIKLRFGAFASNAIGQDIPTAAAEFGRGLGSLCQARTQAIAIVTTALTGKE